MRDRISKSEIRRYAVQDGAAATRQAVAQARNIIVGAISDIAETVGGLNTELLEIRDAARRAGQDADPAA